LLGSIETRLEAASGRFPVATGMPEIDDGVEYGTDSRSSTSIGNRFMTDGDNPIWFAEDDVGKSLRTLARPNKMHNAVISANNDLPTVAVLQAKPIAGAGT
jgi:hypothetical protein